ncbi:MAG: DNA-processing protein DprA [Caldimicrobium sp.]
MKEKFLFLGLYLKEGGSFKTSKWLEEFPNIESLQEKFKIKEKELLNLAERELEKAEKLGIKILFIKEEAFPEELRNIPYPPLFLYVKGHLSDFPKFAIVGSRKPSPYGREVANFFGDKLSEAGLCLVSGLARGIDTIVHKVCVERKRPTIAVLGSGLDVIYPAENRELFRKIVETGGTVLSEFPLGTKPRRENFPRRNRIISGLAKAVLVIEAGERSGTLITARWAQEQGKEVFAVPGNIFSDQSKGTNFLIKEGAIPVTSPFEILQYLGLEAEKPSSEKIFQVDLSQEEKEILEILSLGPQHFDELTEKTGLSPPLLLQILTELEFKNLIKSLPGKYFQKIF